jgi:hypothetical protein
MNARWRQIRRSFSALALKPPAQFFQAATPKSNETDLNVASTCKHRIRTISSSLMSSGDLQVIFSSPCASAFSEDRFIIMEDRKRNI